MLRRLSTTLIAALAMLLVSGGPALAAPPQTETTVQKNVVTTFRDVIPTCEQAARPTHTITTTANSVQHSTTFADGRVHITFTQTGTFVARPLNARGVTYRGTFTVWGGFNQNRKVVNGTFTFTVRGKGSDGSRFVTHATDHFGSTPTGAEFFFTRCHD